MENSKDSTATPAAAHQGKAFEGATRKQGGLPDSRRSALPSDPAQARASKPLADRGEPWTIPSTRLRLSGMVREGVATRRSEPSVVRRSGRSLDALLTKTELGELLELDYALASLRNPSGFPGLLARVAQIVPATSILAVASQFDSRRQEARMATSVVHDYPEEWLRQYFCQGYSRIDPILRRYAESFQMVAWSPLLQGLQSKQSRAFVGGARDFGMMHGLTCGIHDPTNSHATLFSLSGKELEREVRHRSVFAHLVPHLSGALIRASGIPANPARVDALSLREIEVLRWMKEGKSNWEVSRILCVSEATVKFHVKNILGKLHASNRSHAVALAMEQRSL
ncbi:MAG: autoinducer binding domain-containing protein [Methylacidiphilaceae bacterium]|nr:autoinducer binding domain-containing protein [Candidatus Methylacidiphilaceae bacterium]